MNLKNAKLGGFALSRNDYLELVRFVRDRDVKTVLEFGPGASTWAFLDADCEVWSIEFEKKYADIASQSFKDFPQVHLIHVGITHPIPPPPEIAGKKFDLCLIDSPHGAYYRYFARLNSCLLAMELSDTILVHDSKRKKDRMTLRFIEDSGWRLRFLNRRKSKFVLCERKNDTHVPKGVIGLPLPFKLK